ncbi:DMT family transporter [Sandaracinus amylolyticus]|uniref:Permeases of the drug/metabolite transporter (DMT) superfamily n=1 Tax=Sandaracinus amylolyticus TaxID=927083 RepID=A0A0F6YFX0_9BACT|nr:DMT family transporter [Sandaracinus amylolyticus]AKF02932.1 Permeases of the drug/metabolite transporter (DMT) superfamily [Sandaracinus amylolyticus]
MATGPWLWALVAAALFGASTPAAKALLGAIGPFTLAGLLYLGAALAVAPSARAWPRAALREGATRWRLGGAVLFGGVIGPALLMLGLRAASVSVREPLTTVSIVATGLLAVALLMLPRDRHAHAHRHERTRHAHWHRHDDAHHTHAHERLPRFGWHFHEHDHDAIEHVHPHEPDLHHRHSH